MPAPLLGASDQLLVRYDAASNTYELQLPKDQTWLALAPVAGSGNQWTAAAGGVTLTSDTRGYAALLSWSGPNSFGFTAVGIPTDPSQVPRSGRGVYRGTIGGYSSELGTGGAPGLIGGAISLSFRFGDGSLSGWITPTLTLNQTYDLATLSLTNTVHAVGSPSFSGSFDTSLVGLNSFSGSLAGPFAKRIFGDLAFPYLSPVNGSVQQAAGAFAGIQRPLPEP